MRQHLRIWWPLLPDPRPIMDRVQLLLMGIPLLLFFSDIVTLFSPPPPKPSPHHHHQRHHHPPPFPQKSLNIPTQNSDYVDGVGLGSVVNIDFCASCSYRGTAVTMKKMLETSFPGIDVVLANYPAPFPKRVLGKLVPVTQIGVVAIVLAGDQIFPLLGLMTPPPWYYSLRANRFGTIASTWLLGNFLQSSLQSSGAFEVGYNAELVFSKLKEGRFPGEIELKEIISKQMAPSRISHGLGAMEVL